MLLLILPHSAMASMQERVEALLQQTYGDATPAVNSFMITNEIKEGYQRIMQSPPHRLRQRYWFDGSRAIFVVDALGKERLITAAFIVDNGVIRSTEVIAFREHRGGEIQQPFFTRQFSGLGLNSRGALEQEIDGISGATLSVRAMTRMATLVLYYYKLITGEPR